MILKGPKMGAVWDSQCGAAPDELQIKLSLQRCRGIGAAGVTGDEGGLRLVGPRSDAVCPAKIDPGAGKAGRWWQKSVGKRESCPRARLP